MKENKYDESSFFDKYNQMHRSQKGLDGAGEWYVLKKVLPSFTGKEVLDLGCGFGWHCRYAIEQGASSATGVDISEKMLEKAKEINNLQGITYILKPLEELDFQPNSFDIILSSLTFHYIKDFDEMSTQAFRWLKAGGQFIFSVEHPIFTAYGNQDWAYDENGQKLFWPIDHYFIEGEREAIFLGEKVVKYHKTLTTYLNGLLKAGFIIKEIIEPQPSSDMLAEFDEMKDELRRPMMLLLSAAKKD